jgi:hypothetical protein
MNKENKYYYKDGTISNEHKWYRVLHREDGPAAEYASGTKQWWIDGKLHRTGGPAIEHASGTKNWYIEDKYHRVDGPAIEWANGSKWWYIGGEEYTEQDFNIIIEEVNKMSTAMKLIDPRWWVRELGEKEIHEQGK